MGMRHRVKKWIVGIPLVCLGLHGTGEKALAQTPICCQGVTFFNGFNNPAGLAIQYGLGLIYVGDRANHQVQVLNMQGMSVTAFSASPPMDSVDVSVDTAGNIFVADYNGGLIREFNSSYNEIPVLFTGGPPSLPRGLWVDGPPATESLYISYQDSSVIRFDRGSTVFSAAVTYPGLTGVPDQLVKQGNYLYVADTTSNQIAKFDVSGGAPVTVYSITGPYGIRTDLAGNFFVVGGNVVFRYGDLAAAPVTDCLIPNFPWSAVVNPAGEVFVSEYDGTGVTVIQSCVTEPSLTPTPTFTPTPTPTSTPPASVGQFFLYPSPATGTTATAAYYMAQPGQMELRVWNEKAEIVTRVTDSKPAGSQVTPFSIAGFGSGIYFYSLTLTYSSGAVEKFGPKKFAILH